LLDAILTMIGYYVIILTAAMVLIVVVVQVFKALSTRRENSKPTEPSEPSGQPVEEISEELAALAIAAVSCMLGAEKPTGVSAWSRIEIGAFSPWKIASRSRRVPRGGG
jgi:hypothetical protein